MELENSFIANSNLASHLPTETDGNPIINVRLFQQALQRCAAYLADWATWQIQRRGSHQSMLLARSFRTHWLNPLQETILRIASSERVDKLQHECDEWREAMPYLFRVLSTCIPRSSSTYETVIVFSTLYLQLGKVPDDSLAYSVLMSTWRDALQILANQVRRAVFEGDIDDHFCEFFIAEIPRKSKKANVLQLPFQRYQVAITRLPCFVSAATADNILFAVHAIDCNAIINDASKAPGVSLSSLEASALSSKEMDEAFERMARHPMHSCLILDGASLRWRENAARALSEKLPVEEIRSGLATMRAYLLLGDELFWRAFFDELRTHESIFKEEKLTPKEKTQAERILRGILSSVHAESGGASSVSFSDAKQTARDAEYSIPLVLKINESGAVIPKYSLKESESILLAPSTFVYCDVFSMAFSVRRVGRELQKCFQKLMWLSRQYRDKNDPVVRVSKQHIRSLSLLRAKMGIVIDAIEYYIQCAVVQPQYEKLDALLKQPEAGSETKSPRRDGTPLYDQFNEVQDESVKIIREQCMFGNALVMERYDQIFSACLTFCSLVQAVQVEGTRWTLDMCIGNIEEPEMIFSRNVSLLSKLLGRTHTSSLYSSVFELQRKLENVSNFSR